MLIFFLLALVLLRALPFFIYGGIHFDSDQATFGLMSIHIAQLKAFPIFMYGQKYMLAVQSWLAAPLFALWGPSISALKAPTLLWNGLAIWLLFQICIRDLKLSRWQSFFACLPLALPSIAMARQWVDASGGHIEPIVYTLALYKFRKQMIPLAIISAIAVLHREYCLASVLAIGGLNYVEAGSTIHWKKFLKWLAVFLGVVAIAEWLPRFGSTNFIGPTQPIKFNHGLDRFLESFAWIGKHFAALLGIGFQRMDMMPVPFQGGSFLNLIAILVLVLMAAAIVIKRPSQDRVRAFSFSGYLILTALLSAGFYEFKLQAHDAMLVRYLLLGALIPSALLIVCFDSGLKKISISAAVMSVLFSFSNGLDLGRYWHELNSTQPRDLNGEIAQELEKRGIVTGIAPYWKAYDITFRTHERVKIDSNERVRVPEYRTFYQEHLSGSVRIQTEDCPDADAFSVSGLKICINR